MARNPLAFALLALPLFVLAQGLNLKPIIGILSQEPSSGMRRTFAEYNYRSYIASSYVKYIESAGARVVPILIDQDDSYYTNLMQSLNGVVFPGGSASITNRSGYGRAGRVIYDHILQAADEGNIIPLFTICLGFEMLMHLHANNTNPLTRCEARNVADPLLPVDSWSSSQLFGNAPNDVIETLTTTNSTSNFHKYCVTPETFEDLELDQDFLLLSTSNDTGNVTYISTVEHRTLPIYGFQWHPEKNIFEWKYSSIPHSPDAIRASQYLANVFVNKARENNQSFSNESEENAALIYGYQPQDMRNFEEYRSSFLQCYFFEPRPDEEDQ